MTDRDELPALLGKWVTVTNPHAPVSWSGTLLGLADDPSVLIEGHNGHRMCLPQSFTVERSEPRPETARTEAQSDPELQQLRAQLARVQELAAEYPVHIDTAFVLAVLDGRPVRDR